MCGSLHKKIKTSQSYAIGAHASFGDLSIENFNYVPLMGFRTAIPGKKHKHKTSRTPVTLSSSKCHHLYFFPCLNCIAKFHIYFFSHFQFFSYVTFIIQLLFSSLLLSIVYFPASYLLSISVYYWYYGSGV